MKILLVAGGKRDLWPNISVSQYDLFVGIDRGCLAIIEQGWPLTAAIGDFDSITDKEKDAVMMRASMVITAPAEKDETDTQLALHYVFTKYPDAQVNLVGATGGRLDHLLSNLWLGVEPRFNPFLAQIIISDKQNYLTFHAPGQYTIQQQAGMSYLAYCCLTPVQNLTLVDSKYILTNQQVDYPTSFGSNEFIGETASFSFSSGVVAVIQSKDSVNE